MINKSNHHLWRGILAFSSTLLMILACDAPFSENQIPREAARPTIPLEPRVSINPSEVPSLSELASTPTDDTPALDPMIILGSYSSLVEIKQSLEGIVAENKSDGTTLTGLQLLQWILYEQQFNPTEDNSLKEQVLVSFDAYEFLYPGARIFIVNVAIGLFAEAHNLYPWSLRDYSAQEIRNIFIQDSSLYVTDPTLPRGDFPLDMPNLKTHTYPMDNKVVENAHYKQFNLARKLTKDATTAEGSISLLVVWFQQNFFHAIEGYGWEVYLDGQTPRTNSGPVAYPLSIERIYQERVIGCHEPTILLEGMLHSLNIPAIRLSVHGHGVLYLPTLDRYVHGDHIAAYTDAPLGMLLLSPDEFRPYAEDVSWIFAIVYPDKYQTPFGSTPLKRDGNYLYIQASNIRNFPATTCKVVSQEDFTRISQQLVAYNIQYDSEECELTSDKVLILTLDQLNTDP